MTEPRYRITMSQERLEAVAQECALPLSTIRDYCLDGGWLNAREYQEWLNSAPLATIARWVALRHQDAIDPEETP